MTAVSAASFCGIGGLSRAHAFEIFGITLFGDSAEEKAAKAAKLYYKVEFDIRPADDEIREKLEAVSTLQNLRNRPPADVPALRARAQADVPRLVAGLYTEGRYGGTVDISIAGRPLASIRPSTPLRRGDEPLPIRIVVDTGPEFVFGSVRIRQPSERDGAPSADPRLYGMEPGETARSDAVLDAENKVIRAWREAGYPLAEVTSRDVVADHKTARLNVVLDVRSDRRANFGEVTVDGTEHMDAAFTARHTGIVAGSRYSPVDVEEARERLRRLDVFESVRITESNALTKGDRLPVAVTVTERKRRIIGANVGWSSIDGGELEAYWGHRNLFGRAERVRIEGTVAQFGARPFDELKYRIAVAFLKPGVLDVDTDLFANAILLREHPEAYESRSATTELGLRHRFTRRLTGSIAGEVEVSETDDAFGTETFTLVGVPASLTYDSRDNLLDPTRGFLGTARFEPFYDLLNDNVFFVSRADLTAYRGLDEDNRFIAAGRIGVGTIAGADLDEIPADRRFFAGGGGSIRGYAYRNVGPRRNGEVVGGRSVVEASAELRTRITETVGIVPFIDAGLVAKDPIPGSGVKFQVGAGLGLRYYTAIGPVRFDLAVPFDPEDDDPDFAFYAGLGQAF